MLCSALAELDAIAKRVTAGDEQTADSMQSAELAAILQHKYWAYRRYRHEAAMDAMASGIEAVTTSAQSLGFYLDSGLRSGRLRLFASDEAAAKVLTENLAGVQLKMESVTTSSGHASEAIFSLDGSELSAERVFNVLAMFGFGIYL